MSLEALPVENLRLVGAVIGVLILVYWTIERARGQGEDPTIRKSAQSDTGSMSFLVSGYMAVTAVAGTVAALLLWPGDPLVNDSGAVLFGLGLVAFAHWLVEKEETEG